MLSRIETLLLRTALLTASLGTLALTGCGAGSVSVTSASHLALIPSSSSVEVGSSLTLTPVGSTVDPSTCTYSSAAESTLTPAGAHALSAAFTGRSAGTTEVTVSCGTQSASSVVRVGATAKIGPLRITRGGTYSGTYASTNPSVPAVFIQTDEPVVLENSTLSSLGDLIYITGVSTGAQVTIKNVTGTALDPGVAGLQRGRFIVAGQTTKLTATNNTMHGVSYGLLTGGTAMNRVVFKYNLAYDMEDRASDGKGGLLPVRPTLGHFVILQRMSVSNGAEIAWNQMRNTIGSTSMEDTINLYDALGTSDNPIAVHDNFLEGAASAATTYYTGDGITTDGPGNDGGPETGFVTITSNHVIHTAGGGIALAAGHDITAKGNHIVSCGRDAQGNWYAMPFTNGIDMFNIYLSPLYGNNVITTTTGGLVRPTAELTPQIADIAAGAEPAALDSSMAGNLFSDPCLVNGVLDLSAEQAERNLWAKELKKNKILLGDQH
jgi:hypothetical protein